MPKPHPHTSILPSPPRIPKPNTPPSHAHPTHETPAEPPHKTLTARKPTDSKPFFTGWAVVSFIWVWASMCICVIYPAVESRAAIRAVWRGLLRDGFAVVGMR